jgi:hypothetical protein
MNAILVMLASEADKGHIRVPPAAAVAPLLHWSAPAAWGGGVSTALVQRRRIYSNMDKFAALAGLPGARAAVPLPALDLLMAARRAPNLDQSHE